MATDRFDPRDCSNGGQTGLSHGLIRTCSSEIIFVDTVFGDSPAIVADRCWARLDHRLSSLAAWMTFAKSALT
jgi:hypothetical protein